MKTALVAAALLATLALPAAGEPRRFEVRLQPGKVHEECLKVEAGGARTHDWTSDAPVDFNIHYHRGKEVHYPVQRDAVAADRGRFSAKTTEDYCWMWTAGKQPARIRGRIE